MPSDPETLLTEEGYLAIERQAEFRSEFYQRGQGQGGRPVPDLASGRRPRPAYGYTGGREDDAGEDYIVFDSG